MSEFDPILLAVNDLATTFQTAGGPLPAVGGVSFELKRNETIGVVGESGSGKTVLTRTIMGLQQRTNVTVTGSVLLDGHRNGQARPLGLGSRHDLPGPHDIAQPSDARR